MHLYKKARVVLDGAVFTVIITASVEPAPARGWFTLPTVVTRDGEPVPGIVWSCHAEDISGGFLHSTRDDEAESLVLSRLTEALLASRPRMGVIGEARAVG